MNSEHKYGLLKPTTETQFLGTDGFIICEGNLFLICFADLTSIFDGSFIFALITASLEQALISLSIYKYLTPGANIQRFHPWKNTYKL